jgi:hypothetical protein
MAALGYDEARRRKGLESWLPRWPHGSMTEIIYRAHAVKPL